MARKKKKTLRRWLLGLIFRLALLGVLCFGLALGVLWLAETNPAPAHQQTDALIVLGAQVYPDGSLSPQLEMRMEAALEAYRLHPRPIIVCGAQGGNEPCPEGEAMAQWLLRQGVPAEDVIAETQSLNTHQNIRNAIALLPEGAAQATLITSDYHLPRALAICRDLGLEAEGMGSPCKPEYWFKNHAREVLAWGKYFLNKMVPLE